MIVEVRISQNMISFSNVEGNQVISICQQSSDQIHWSQWTTQPTDHSKLKKDVALYKGLPSLTLSLLVYDVWSSDSTKSGYLLRSIRSGVVFFSCLQSANKLRRKEAGEKKIARKEQMRKDPRWICKELSVTKNYSSHRLNDNLIHL